MNEHAESSRRSETETQSRTDAIDNGQDAGVLGHADGDEPDPRLLRRAAWMLLKLSLLLLVASSVVVSWVDWSMGSSKPHGWQVSLFYVSLLVLGIGWIASSCFGGWMLYEWYFWRRQASQSGRHALIRVFAGGVCFVLAALASTGVSASAMLLSLVAIR